MHPVNRHFWGGGGGGRLGVGSAAVETDQDGGLPYRDYALVEGIFRQKRVRPFARVCRSLGRRWSGVRMMCWKCGATWCVECYCRPPRMESFTDARAWNEFVEGTSLSG